MSLKKHLLYNLNWSCFKHTVACTNVTMPHLYVFENLSRNQSWVNLFSVLQDSILDAILNSLFSILDSQFAQELRIANWVKNWDFQWTVNLLLNGTVNCCTVMILTVVDGEEFGFYILQVEILLTRCINIHFGFTNLIPCKDLYIAMLSEKGEGGIQARLSALAVFKLKNQGRALYSFLRKYEVEWLKQWDTEGIFSLYQIAFAPLRKLCWIWHKKGDFGAISLTERSCAAPILKWRVTYWVGVHTLPDSFSCRHE